MLGHLQLRFPQPIEAVVLEASAMVDVVISVLLSVSTEAEKLEKEADVTHVLDDAESENGEIHTDDA